MNAPRIVACIFILVLPVIASAAPPPAPGAQLPAWEQLSAEQRELLVAPLRERWNASPEDRGRLLEHARRWRELPPDQRERARRGVRRFEQMSPEQRQRARAIFHQTRGMSPEERRAFMQRWKEMSPAERAEWLRTHPAPATP